MIKTRHYEHIKNVKKVKIGSLRMLVAIDIMVLFLTH